MPGTPLLWIFLAAAPLVPVYFLSGELILLAALIVALVAMVAAVTRAYQDAALIQAAEDRTRDAEE
ncbi:hypothetical protein [Nonomuraea sp. NEAU-A123]|uniref:hypothetical protein n=1 Tax=Nonomuraea sp. NEAU-A123 TaxID=2839649 RepID=UPI001BE400B6|nr:hypothetical protein [Nonomuraea sp. NEAU-A123]MBT2233848.1 hypothetical protein [Nonomuraea sp. NEAU-A123]